MKNISLKRRYLQAARYLWKNRGGYIGCCDALMLAPDEDPSGYTRYIGSNYLNSEERYERNRAVDLFEYYFRPPEAWHPYWMMEKGDSWDDPALLERRILALCFMACITEGEEKL